MGAALLGGGYSSFPSTHRIWEGGGIGAGGSGGGPSPGELPALYQHCRFGTSRPSTVARRPAYAWVRQ